MTQSRRQLHTITTRYVGGQQGAAALFNAVGFSVAAGSSDDASASAAAGSTAGSTLRSRLSLPDSDGIAVAGSRANRSEGLVGTGAVGRLDFVPSAEGSILHAVLILQLNCCRLGFKIWHDRA